MTRSVKLAIKLITAGLVVFALGVVLWGWRFHKRTPGEVVLDLRAAMQARGAARPAERFLELRYGPLTEPANRQKAFLDFFDLGHMEGMRLIVGHIKGAERRTNIAATAQWIANYRNTMTPAEKQALDAYFRSDYGRSQLRKATGQYLSQDVVYRSATAPVIVELMTTLSAVQNP